MSSILDKSDYTVFTDQTAWQSNKKPDKCTKCPLCKKEWILEPKEAADVLIILPAPVEEDIHKPFLTSRNWWLLKKIIRYYEGWYGSKIACCFGTLCPTIKDKIPASVYKQCSHRLYSKIADVNPKVVLTLGIEPAKQLGLKGTISSMRGTISKWNNIWVIPTYGAKYYFGYKHKLFSMLLLDLKKAVTIAKNPSFALKDIGSLPIKIYSKEEDIVSVVEQFIFSGQTTSFDVETVIPGRPELGLDPQHPESAITVLALSQQNNTVSLDLRKATPRIMDVIKKLFLSCIPKLGHNVKFDMGFIHNKWGYVPTNVVADTLLNQYLLNETRAGGNSTVKGEYTLEKLIWDYLPEYGGHKAETQDKIKHGTLQEEDFQELLLRAGADAYLTLLLYEHQQKQLIKEPKLMHFSTSFFLPAVYMLEELEQEGLTIDVPYLNTLDIEIDTKLKESTDYFQSITWKGFNPNSEPDQIKFLYNQLKLPISLYTDAGRPSVSEEALSPLAKTNPIVAKLLEHTTLQKLSSSFLKNIKSRLKGKKVYPTYMLEGTRTGRLSCSDPPVQTIPKKMLEYNVKKIFIEEDPYTFMALDYSQMEVVILANLARDELLLEAVSKGFDVHSYVTSQIMRVDYSQVDKDKEPYASIRDQAKKTVFGMIYGSTAVGMAKKQGWSVKDTEMLFDTILQRFSNLRRYITDTHSQVRQHGFVYSPFGRKRRFPILTFYPGERSSLRAAQNMPIQSAASDYTVDSMLLLKDPLKQLDSRLTMQVHDMIGMRVPKNRVPDVLNLCEQKLYKEATSRYKDWLLVPPHMDVYNGPSWGELIKIKTI